MFPLLLHLTSRVYLGRGLTKHIWLSDFLRNLLYLIIVPQLQWNLICLKWVEILEHNIWRKRLKQRLFNIHSSELRRKKKTVFEEILMNSVPCHYNCRQKQIINYFKSFPTSKNIYRRPQNFCKNAQELLTTFYLAGVKLLKRKIIQDHTWCFRLHYSNIWWIQSSYLNCGKWFDFRSDG